MTFEIKNIIEQIYISDQEDKAVELINSITTDERQKIIKNPGYKTFNEYIDHNPEILEDDSLYSKWRDHYESEFEYNKSVWPYIFNKHYYLNGEKVLLAFFRKYPEYIREFLDKQNLV